MDLSAQINLNILRNVVKSKMSVWVKNMFVVRDNEGWVTVDIYWKYLQLKWYVSGSVTHSPLAQK